MPAHPLSKRSNFRDLLSLRGRASRSDWWIITIFAGLLAQLFVVVVVILSLQESALRWVPVSLAVVAGLVALWACVAVTAQRFRDRGESPWLTLLLLVPVVGELFVILVCGILPNPRHAKRRLVVRRVEKGCVTAESEV